MLWAERLEAGYGDVRVIRGADLVISPGEVVALVGSNGAGKTTLLKTISGLVKPTSGRLLHEGREITDSGAHERVRSGIVLVPEGRQLFSGMTVRENIMAGAYLLSDKGVVRDQYEFVMGLFPELQAKFNRQAGTLSGGEGQMCAIARGLMSRPKVLLIDELSWGLAPLIVDRLFEMIQRIHRETEIAILLVDQDVQRALQTSDRGYVLENGAVVQSGTSAELLANDELVKFVLGV